MTKFITSAEASELSMAVSELFPLPALVLAAAELQGNSASAQQGGLLGSGAISGVAGFVRDQMQAGIVSFHVKLALLQKKRSENLKSFFFLRELCCVPYPSWYSWQQSKFQCSFNLSETAYCHTNLSKEWRIK